MATKADFTPEEWQLLCKAPLLAGLVVVVASPSGPIGVIQEMFALAKLIAETRARPGSSGLIDAVIAEISTREGMQKTRPGEIKGLSPEQARLRVLDECRQVGALLDGKAGAADAASFKDWLGAVARRVAEASKEGGFLGFGGTLVSDQEQAALKDLAAALGSPPG